MQHPDMLAVLSVARVQVHRKDVLGPSLTALAVATKATHSLATEKKRKKMSISDSKDAEGETTNHERFSKLISGNERV